MYLRKIRPSTTCLYSAASRLPRSLSAVAQSVASKPRAEPLLREAGFELVLAIVATVAKTPANSKQDQPAAHWREEGTSFNFPGSSTSVAPVPGGRRGEMQKAEGRTPRLRSEECGLRKGRRGSAEGGLRMGRGGGAGRR